MFARVRRPETIMNLPQATTHASRSPPGTSADPLVIWSSPLVTKKNLKRAVMRPPFRSLAYRKEILHGQASGRCNDPGRQSAHQISAGSNPYQMERPAAAKRTNGAVYFLYRRFLRDDQ